MRYNFKIFSAKTTIIISILFVFFSLSSVFLLVNKEEKEQNTINTSTQIEIEEISFFDINPDTTIDKNHIITLPQENILDVSKPLFIEASFFFTTKYSNVGSTHSFDYDKFQKFIKFYKILDNKYYHFIINAEDNDVLILGRGYPRTDNRIISFFNETDALISFHEYIDFKSIIAQRLNGTRIHESAESLDNRIKFMIADVFSFLLPNSEFNFSLAEYAINFFDYIEDNKPFKLISYFEDAKEDLINHSEQDFDYLLNNYKTHYNNIVNLDKEESIENFKLNNYIKVPKNDNDVCFVKIPDNVEIDYSTIGEINFTFKGYTLDAYNCNEK